MVTFVESPLFTKQVHDYLTDDEYRVFQAFLATSPDAGDVVRGSGAFARFAGTVAVPAKAVASGYYFLPGQKPVRSWLLLIYAKSAVDSIPGHILKALKVEMEHATR